MKVVYDNLLYAKNAVDALSKEDLGVWEAAKLLGTGYSKDAMEKIKSTATLSKFLYKFEYPNFINGQETWWYYIKEECRNNCNREDE